MRLIELALLLAGGADRLLGQQLELAAARSRWLPAAAASQVAAHPHLHLTPVDAQRLGDLAVEQVAPSIVPVLALERPDQHTPGRRELLTELLQGLALRQWAAAFGCRLG